MQDGAPPHWHRKVRDWLNEFFEERWIGRSGTIPWPARSPDLTPCDLWLWDDLKRKMYGTRLRDLSHLKAKVIKAAEETDIKTCQSALMAFKKRLSDCVANKGSHIEH